MTPDRNQLALDALDRLSRDGDKVGSRAMDLRTLDYITVQEALTAQPVTDDEVVLAKNSVRVLREWCRMNSSPRGDAGINWLASTHLDTIEKTLIRAATAPKNCDIPEKLPCDVTIGVANFMRGTPTRFVTDRIKWWQDMKDQGNEAPKNRCDPDKNCDALVKALENIVREAVLHNETFMVSFITHGKFTKLKEALAAHRAQEGK